MKKNLVLHIGMGKTGTTALQEFFWLNRAQLKECGIFYPTYGTVAHAHHLLSPFTPNDLKNEWKFIAASEWIPKLNGTPSDSILLSSELIAWASRDEIVDFCRSVQAWFNVTVVIYLRRQDNMVIANYNQLVKAGSQRRELDQTWEEDAARFDYWKIIEPWANCLGSSHIVVRPYERQQFHLGDIRHDFMHYVFGVEISAKYKMSSANFNPRLSPFAIAYKFRLYDLFKDRGQVERFSDALLGYSSELDISESGIFSDQPLLSPGVRNLIINRASDSNERIAREFMGREDGILFVEPSPDESECWEPLRLNQDQAKAISHYIGSLDSKLVRLLFDEIHEGLTSSDSLRRTTAEFLRPSLPIGIIGGIRERDLQSFLNWKHASEPRLQEATPLFLISLHLPAVTVDDFVSEIDRRFGEYVVLDYADKPIGASNLSRNWNALQSCLHYVSLVHESDHPVCVHGHFLPLKYRLFQTSLQKRFVTWLRDPVDRLVEHYWLWKDSAEDANSGKLRRRMMLEDWSLERFAFCPEIRNIYSKFLWGFPLRYFDFVGIVEFHDSELLRFSRDILGSARASELPGDATHGYNAPHIIDQGFRKRVERHHAADVSLYRNALELRRMKLQESLAR